MKQLYFIDNEDEGNAFQTLAFDIDKALRSAGLPEEQILSLKTISGFWRKEDKNDVYDVVFNTNNVIITHSSYAIKPGLWDSKRQFLSLLATAGTSEIRGVTYLDMSGLFPSQIPNELKSGNVKRLWQVLTAIEKNTIITRQINLYYRISVDFSMPDGFGYKLIKLIDHV